MAVQIDRLNTTEPVKINGYVAQCVINGLFAKQRRGKSFGT